MKKLQNNKKQILVAIFCLLSTMFVPMHAQDCFNNNYMGFTNTTDYLNVNRNNFIVTNADSDLENYHHTAFKLAIEIGKIADFKGNERVCSETGFHQNTPINIMNKYTAYRIEYTPDIQASFLFSNIKFKLRAVVIKPNNAINAPCVFVAHGSGGLLRDWMTNAVYGVYDYLMRGYTVVVYENLTTLRRVPDKNSVCVMYNNPQLGGNLPGMPIGVVATADIAPLHRWRYFSYATAEAVVKYVTSNSSLYNINPNNTHVYGFSYGTTNAETILFMKRSEFPSGAYSGTAINPKNFTLPSVETYSNYTVKAGIVMGSMNYNGIDFWQQPMHRNVYTADDTMQRLLMIHGKQDNATNYSKYDNVFVNNADILGTPPKINILNSMNIKNTLITACNQNHVPFQNFNNFHSEAVGSLNPSSTYYPFYTFVSNLTTANIGTMKAGINANSTYQQYFNTFKEINNQVFQIYKSGTLFLKNTMDNTSYVICASENPSDRKMFINNSGVPASTYNANNWLYQIYNSACQPNSGQRFAKETEYIQEFGFKTPMLYPNPSNGIFTINVSVQEEINNYQVNVFNTNGQLVNTKIETKNLLESDVINETIDISDQAKGIYFINIVANGKIIFSESAIIK